MKHTTIIINGRPGTGSTSVSKVLSEELGIEHVYAGGMFRAMAAEAGVQLEDFLTAIADDPDRERSIDDGLIDRAREGNVIIESRVLGWILPDDVPAFRIWLTCDIAERVRRIHQRDATEDVKKKMRYRDELDTDRFKKLYNIDLDDLSPFDLVIDTSTTPVDQVVAQIETALKA